MRSNQLRLALIDFVEEASLQLSREMASGAEVPFEIVSQRSRRQGTPLYSYRPLTGRFIAARADALATLPSHAAAMALLAGLDGLDGYLLASGLVHVPADARSRARAALLALLSDVFCEQTDFQLRPARCEDAVARLGEAAGTGPHGLLVVVRVDGLVLTSAQVTLPGGLALAAPGDWRDLPGELESDTGGTPHVLAIASVRAAGAGEALRQAVALLGSLLRALRLYGDERISLAAPAWSRAADGPWCPLLIGAESGPATRGALVLPAEREQELRAFVDLLWRRAPEGDELAWALRRYEMGCERASEHEALSDYILALRCLLEPEGPSSGLLLTRLAALCAGPDGRGALAEEIARAVELERAIMRGAVAHGQDGALVRDIADHLRMLLCDVICGRLDADLSRAADELLSPREEELDGSQERTIRLQGAPKAPARPRRAREPARSAPAARGGRGVSGGRAVGA